MIKKRINLRWSCQNGIRADNISKELAEAMYKSGCHTVTFGVESGDTKVFNFINKSETLSQIAESVKIFKNTGIRVGGYFIIGLPYDNYKKTKKSVEFAKRIGMDWAHFNMLSLYPGTKLWDWIQKNGKIINDYRKTFHFGERINPVFETDTFSVKNMIKAYEMVHTRQLLFHLLLPQELSPVRKNIRKFILLLKYNPRFIIHQIGVIYKKLPKLIIKISLYEIKKRTAKNFYFHCKEKEVPNLKKELKILHINNIYDWTGGTEIYMINTCEELSKLGHKIVIIYDKKSKIVNKKKWRLYNVPGISEYQSEYNEKSQTKFMRIIKKEKPDIIHLHNVYNPYTIMNSVKSGCAIRTIHDYYSICPALNKYLSGSNKICKQSFGLYCLFRLPWDHCVGIDMEFAIRRIFEKIEEVEANKKLRKILVASNYMKRQLIRNGISSKQITIQPYFSDLYQKSKMAIITYNEKLILSIGRITFLDKGFEYLLDALSFLKNEYRAVIIGDGPGLNFLKQKVTQLGLNDKVQFTGWLSRDKISNYYSRCRVVVVPSMWAEPFGIVGIEAFYYGKPVVAFNVGGISDWLVNNKNGFLVPRGNIKKMSKKIQLLLEDETLARIMGNEGRRTAEEKYSPHISIKKLLDLYKGILS